MNRVVASQDESLSLRQATNTSSSCNVSGSIKTSRNLAKNTPRLSPGRSQEMPTMQRNETTQLPQCESHGTGDNFTGETSCC